MASKRVFSSVIPEAPEGDRNQQLHARSKEAGDQATPASFPVNHETRLLVRGCGRSEVDGTYIARWVQLVKPDASSSSSSSSPPPTLTVGLSGTTLGRTAELSSGENTIDHSVEKSPGPSGSQLRQLQFVKEKGPACRIVFSRRVRNHPPTWRILWKTNILYEAQATSTWSMPTAWQAASGPYYDQLVPAPDTLDVTRFRDLVNEVGWAQAAWTHVKGFIGEEYSHIVPPTGSHNLPRDAPTRSMTASSKVGAMDGSQYVEPEEDEEVFYKGSSIIVKQDKIFMKKELEELGVVWDQVQASYLPLLGHKYQVLDVDSYPGFVVIEGPSGPVPMPPQTLDLDYTDVAQFYVHTPKFIVLQTLAFFLLWVYFAFRDAGRDDSNWTATMGGLESIWPGQTSLLLTRNCEDLRSQPWRWLSYQFTHVGLAHAASNAIVNLLLGFRLEQFHGTLLMVLMYELGVLGGAFCYFVVDAHLPVVGSSGGCFSLIGIRLGDLFMNWAERPMRYWRLVFLISLVAVNVLVETLSEPEGGTATSNAAHFGGAVAGLLIGIIAGRNLVSSNRELLVKLGVGFLSVILILFCLGWVLQWPPRSIFEDEPWCWIRQVSNKTITGTWDWLCVRCQTESCINDWMKQQRIYIVSQATCAARGGYWYTESS